MKTERYFYSKGCSIAKMEALLDSNGKIINYRSNYKTVIRKAPRVTICGIYDKEKSQLVFGMTICASKDNFNKRIGREIAKGKALKKPCLIVNVTNTTVLNETFIKSARVLEASAIKDPFKSHA